METRQTAQQTMIDGETLRGVMRRVPAPVTVVTAAGREEARGATIGSFTSVSLEPPLVSFNVERESQMHDVMEEASRFAVHTLCREQAHLSAHFAVPDCSGVEQLRPVPHRLDIHGTPILEEALSVLHCRLHDTFRAGDHTIVVGEVVEIDRRAEGAPLLYYDRSYHSINELAVAS